LKLGRHKSFIYSLILHLLILIALVYFSKKSTPLNQEKPKVKTVKSYIYQHPKPKAKVEKRKPDIIEQKKANEPKIAEKIEKKLEANPPQESQTAKQPIAATAVPAVIPETSEKKEQETQATFSPYAQLNKLRSDINQNISTNDIPSYRGSTSGSPMHGRPEVVPDSIVPETSDARHARTTQRYSDRLAITKNENGTCTIVEDLSAVGIEGVKAVSGFNCGESKDKKAFRKHMEGVLKKLGKSN